MKVCSNIFWWMELLTWEWYHHPHRIWGLSRKKDQAMALTGASTPILPQVQKDKLCLLAAAAVLRLHSLPTKISLHSGSYEDLTVFIYIHKGFIVGSRGGAEWQRPGKSGGKWNSLVPHSVSWTDFNIIWRETLRPSCWKFSESLWDCNQEDSCMGAQFEQDPSLPPIYTAFIQNSHNPMDSRVGNFRAVVFKVWSQGQPRSTSSTLEFVRNANSPAHYSKIRDSSGRAQHF